MGWMELLLIGVVALIVVGPKDLPVMFQSLGKMSAKVKRMARDFSTAMNDAANATGASDIAKDLKGMTSTKGLGIDALKDAADKFDKWEPGKEPRVMGSETAKLAAERAEATRKAREEAAKRSAATAAGAETASDEAPEVADAEPPKAAKPDWATKPAPKTGDAAAAEAEAKAATDEAPGQQP